MKACVSVGERDLMDDLSSCRRAVELGADMIEVRFDLISPIPSTADEFAEIRVPKIATLRMADQGGSYKGNDVERLALFKSAIKSGFEYIDLEYNSQLLNSKDLSDARIICSFHDFEGTPATARVVDILVECLAKGQIAKAAFKVNSIRDLVSIVDASRFVSSTEKQFVIGGMGDLGEITRIRSDRFNSCWTYVSIEKGKGTAPGQLDLETMKWLGSCPVILGLTGHPLRHSVSPAMHNAALRALSLPGKYLLFPALKEELDDLVYIMTEMDIRGMNITIPHKESIMEWLDELSPEAKAIGAVNVVVNNKGRFTGLNTDEYGIKKTFEAAEVQLKGKKALVIGAGGVARACCAFLRKSGASIFIFNRTRSHAEKIASDFGATVLDDSQMQGMGFDVIINCTPLGMKGFPDISPIPEKMFAPGQAVMDVTYNPPTTPFLKAAEAQGATVLQGMEMLIYQAINAFEAWTGRTPPYEVMARAAREAVE